MIIAYLIFGGFVALHLYVIYVFYNLMLVVWIPQKAKKRWVNVVDSPAGQICYPLIKWLSPISVVVMPLSLIVGVLNIWLGGNAT